MDYLIDNAPVLPPGMSETMSPSAAAAMIYQHATALFTAGFDKQAKTFKLTAEEAALLAMDVFNTCFDHGALLHRSASRAEQQGNRDIYLELTVAHAANVGMTVSGPAVGAGAHVAGIP